MAGSTTDSTVPAPYSPRVAATAAPSPKTTATGVPIRRARVSSSNVGLATEASVTSATTMTSDMT